MSQSVDSRIVELQFNSAQFQEKAKSAIEGLTNLKTSVDKLQGADGFKALSSAASSNSKSISEISSAVDTVSSRFSTLGIIGMTVLQNLTNSATNLAKNMVNSVTLQPIKDGLSEYELQINSVQTIMANTGKDVKTVNAALDELNTYADLTIYKFGDMTKNAGMFTAAGVSLEDTMTAMKGIGNWAAFAGASTSDMSRATYQLGQSLATGTIKLRDWMSIENTGGMAGKKYQEAFMETARQHGVAVDQIVKANGSFRESLSEGWLTSEIFIETMQKFATDQSMTDAATKVKTFTQLIDTLKEALGTGWAQIWRTVIGDFEEAKALWTGVNDVLSKIINDAFSKISKSFEDWADLTGRYRLMHAFKMLAYTIGDFAKAVSKAWHSVFKPITGKTLYSITEKFDIFATNLRSSLVYFKNWDQVTSILTSVFKALKLVGKGFVYFLKVSYAAFDLFLSMLNPILAIGVGMSNLVIKVLDLVDSFNILSGVSSFISGVFNGIGEALEYVGDKLGAAYKVIKDAAGDIFGAIGKAFVDTFGDINKVAAIFNGAGVIGILVTLQKLSKGLQTPITLLEDLGKSAKGVFNGFTGIFEGIAENLDEVRKSLVLWQAQLQARIILELAVAVGVLAFAIATLAEIPRGKLMKSCFAIELMAIELATTMMIINKSGILNPKMWLFGGKVGQIMIEIAGAIYILSKACAIIGKLDTDSLIRGLAGISILMGEMVAMVTILSAEKANKMTKGIVSVIAIAYAIKILANAVTSLSGLSWTELAKGLSGVAGLLLAIGLFVRAGNASKGLIQVGVSMVLISYAIKILADSVITFSKLDLNSIVYGLSSLAVILTEIALFSHFAGSGANLIGVGIGMVAMSAAISMLVKSVSSLGGMSLETLGKGLGALAVGLAEISLTANTMKGALVGAIAMGVMVTALSGLIPVIKTIGSMSADTIAKALLSIAAAFIVIGGAAMLMEPAIIPLLGFSAALVVLGVSLNLIGSGLVLIGAGIVSISAGIITTVASISAVIGTFTSTFSLMLSTLLINIRSISQLAASMFVTFVEDIASEMPKLLDAISSIIASILDAILLNGPKIIETAAQLVASFLTELAAHTEEYVDSGAKIITGVLEGLSKNVGSMIQAGYDLIVNLINGLASGIEKNAKPLREAMINLCKSLLKAFADFFGISSPSKVMMQQGGYLIAGLIKGINNKVKNVITAIKSLMTKCVNAIKSFFGKFVSAGKTLISKLGNGVRSAVGSVTGAITSIGNSMVNKVKSFISKFASAGKDLTKGIARGIKNGLSSVISAVGSIARAAKRQFKSLLGINSPSKVFAKLGAGIPEGVAKGVNTYSNLATNAVGNMADDAIESMSSAMNAVSDLDLNTDVESTITPVMDLSNVTSGVGLIDNMLNKSRSINLSSRVSSKSDTLNKFKESLVSGVKDAISSVVSESSDNETTITVPLTIDGKQVAKATAKYTNEELSKLTTRSQRQMGYV